MRLEIAVSLFLSRYDNPNTRDAYKTCLTGLLPTLGQMSVRDVRPAHLVAYVATLDERNFAPATRNKHVKSIKTFFNWLVAIDELPKSPAVAVKTRVPPKRITRDKAMSDSELAAILRITYHKPRDYALILFLADTGARAGGAAGLRICDLDLANRRAVVTEKGYKTRPVVYGEEAAAAIRRWLLERKLHSDYIFSRKATPLSSDQVSQIVRRACLAAGVRSLGSHSLRHRKGHQFADAKIAPSIAATALGHSKPTITLEYYYPQDFESAEKALRELATTLEETKIVKFQKGG